MTWLVERPVAAITRVHCDEGVDPERTMNMRSFFVGVGKDGERWASLKVR